MARWQIGTKSNDLYNRTLLHCPTQTSSLYPDYSELSVSKKEPRVSVISLIPLKAVVRDGLNEPMISRTTLFLFFLELSRRYHHQREALSRSTYSTDFGF